MAEYFYTGPMEYETGWESNESIVNETVSVSSYNGGDNRVLSSFIEIPDYPTGTGYTNQFKFELYYSYICTGTSPQNRYSVNEIWNVSGPLLYAMDDDPCFVKYRIRGPASWSESDSVVFTENYPYEGSMRFKVDAQTEYGLGGSASTSLTIIKVVASRATKTVKVVPQVQYAWWRTNSVDYTIGDVNMVAEGTVNYIAVSR